MRRSGEDVGEEAAGVHAGVGRLEGYTLALTRRDVEVKEE